MREILAAVAAVAAVVLVRRHVGILDMDQTPIATGDLLLGMVTAPRIRDLVVQEMWDSVPEEELVALVLPEVELVCMLTLML